MPVFAFANAGVSFASASLADLFAPLPLGIAAGLFLGKQIGVFGAAWLAVKAGLCRLPHGVTWIAFYGVCLITGIGFTMSLFIGSLAFGDTGEFANLVKLGVLSGSALSAVIGAGILLRAFQSNNIVKALVFMPGATDELYFFRRARADLTNSPASLLDAVSALTNQTLIRATFRPPLLLLHTREDLLEPVIKIEHQPTADKIRQARFVAHGVYDDRDWDYMRKVLKSSLRTDLLPWPRTQASWHFYRHSFAAWDLTGWEALQATALAGETAVTVRRKQVLFEFDRRVRATPKVDAFPR
jgi:hypothetical protein